MERDVTDSKAQKGVKAGDKRGSYKKTPVQYQYTEDVPVEAMDSVIEDYADMDDMSISNSYTMLAIPKQERAIPTKVQLRRLQVHRLVLRGVSRPAIANHLGVSNAVVYKDCVLIYRALRDELENIDLPAFVGITISFYDDIRNTALRIASDTKEKSNAIKLRALETALKIENSKQDYLKGLGLYGSNTDPFGRDETGDDDPATELLSMVTDLISEGSLEMDEHDL